MAASAVHFGFDAVILGIVAWHDKRCYGVVQSVTAIGGGVLLAMIFGRHLLAETAMWKALAGFLASL